MDDPEHQEDILDLVDAIDPDQDDAHEDGTVAQASDEIVIDLYGDDDADEGSRVLRTLREENRKKARRIAELEAAQHPAEIEVGEKPTLEQFDWDQDKWEEAYSGWLERKSNADRAASARVESERETQRVWNAIEDNYRDKAAKLAVPAFEAKEQAVTEALPEILVRAIKAYSIDPAKMIAALGTDRALLDRVADEKDPIKALVSIIRMEDKLTLPRKTNAEPDRPLRGSAPVAAEAQDKALARLEKEAERSGDRTAIIEYKRSLKAKSS